VHVLHVLMHACIDLSISTACMCSPHVRRSIDRSMLTTRDLTSAYAYRVHAGMKEVAGSAAAAAAAGDQRRAQAASLDEKLTEMCVRNA